MNSLNNSMKFLIEEKEKGEQERDSKQTNLNNLTDQIEEKTEEVKVINYFDF